jgi:polyphosphate kinase
MKPSLTALIGLLTASPALAHPHIFVDTGIEVIFYAAGEAEALRLTWTYDELISLTLLTERAMDADFDGALTPEETATLNGFDMNWQPGFEGDSYALLGTTPLVLSGPSDWTVSYDGGKLTSTHLRRFAAPVDLAGQPLVIQSYDPGYYSSYAVTGAKVTGRDDCTAELFEPDRAAADQILQDALAEYSGTDGAEAEFPAVGTAYAEEARITCGG